MKIETTILMLLLAISITGNIILFQKNNVEPTGFGGELDLEQIQEEKVLLEKERDEALLLAEKRKNINAKTCIDSKGKTVILDVEAKDIIKYITKDNQILIPESMCPKK